MQYLRIPQVQTTSGPSQFLLNGAATQVTQDTTTPANSKPLPVEVLDATGVPVGFATAAKQDVANADLSNIQSDLDAINVKTPTLVSGAVPVAVQNFPATQPVSGTVTANQGTAGASAWKVDGSGVTQPVSGSVAVSNFPATQPVSGSVSVSNFPATQPVSAASLPLPTGAATSAAQTTAQTSLTSIDGKLASLGQKNMAGSEPVVIASDQSAIPVVSGANLNGSPATAAISAVTTLTPPTNAVGFILAGDPNNTDLLRWMIGGTATTSTGLALEGSRDTGYVPVKANVSVCPNSGTQTYNIQWVLSS